MITARAARRKLGPRNARKAMRTARTKLARARAIKLKAAVTAKRGA